MDRQQIGLKLALDALGQELDLSSFDPRLALQKTIYLAQATGVDLGYTFAWYLRGPYSPGLTRDVFALQAEARQRTHEWRGWTLDAAAADPLRRLGQMLAGLPADGRVRRLELLASVHFLLQTRQARSDDLLGLQGVLRRNGKEFTESDVGAAIQDLKSHDLLPAGRP